MANNLDILDAAGSTKTVKSTDNTSVHTPHHNIDSIVSGAIASGAVASGAIASGAVASGAFASGALASGSIASGAIAAGAIAAGATSIADNEDAASADGDRGVKIMFKRLDTPANASGTDGDYEQPQMSAGRVWTSTVVTGTVAVTQSGTWDEVGINDSGNSITVDNGGTFAVQAACTNAGTFAVQVDGSALTSLQLIDDTVYTDDAAFTPGTSKVLGVGFEADEGSTDSVDEGDIGAARMTLDRKIIVTPQPHTAGGLSTFMASGSDGSTILVATAQAVKASAGQIYGYYAYNPEAAATFVHFYNVAAAGVTVGTTAPLVSFAIPAGAAANLSFTHGVTFDTAISCSATTTAGGNTAPATGVSLVAWYK